MELLEPN